MASKKPKTISDVEIRKLVPKLASNAQQRGVWVTGFLDRVHDILDPPYRSASHQTLAMWELGWCEANKLVKKGTIFTCSKCGGPLLPDSNRLKRIGYLSEFKRGRRFL